MVDNCVLISLPQLVDLALGSPEVGAVNFNILHSILHVLIQQVDLLETKVEFKENNCRRIANLLNGIKLDEPTLKLTEYVVVSGEQPKRVISKKDRYKKFISEHGSAEEIFVEREVRIVGEGNDAIEISEENPDPQTVVVIETAEAGSQASLLSPQAPSCNLQTQINELKEEIKQLKALPNNADILKAACTSSKSPVIDIIQMLTLSKRVEAAEESLEKLASLIDDLGTDISGRTSSMSMEKKRTSSTYSFASVIHERVTKLEQFMDELKAGDGLTDCELQRTKLAELEARLQEYAGGIETSNNSFDEQLQLLRNQMAVVEKGLLGDASYDKCNRKLYEKVKHLESEFEKLSKTVQSKLFDDDDRQSSLDVLVEQVELLKKVKADHEYIKEALADKADMCLVNRKASKSQFEASYETLSHSLSETIQKLQMQEAMWQQALSDIQQEIETKLDKMELMPLRNFVHNKLKMLQEKLISLTSLKSDPEAAGAKSKLLRNLKCISCDAEVVMRKEVDTSLYQPTVPLPTSKSLSPYLTYELDQLRKQKASTPHSRNLIHFENAVTRDGGKKEHICNRYCGGSHTTTTPQQRVPKGGNFLQQWGVNEKEMFEGNVKGVDGQYYKSRERSDFIQLRCKTDNAYMRTIVVTSDILSERASTKSSTAHVDHKTVLPSIASKAR